MKVVILAGGFGTRITEESQHKPKPMIEIGGTPIIKHIMNIYSSYGFNDFIVLGGYKFTSLKHYFSNPDIRVVNTGLETLTGGRLAQVRELIGNETFMLTYGDGVSDVDIGKLLSFHKSHGKIATVTAVNPEERFGIIDIDSNNKVKQFKEKCKSEDIWINGGFFVLEPQIFDYINGDVMLEHEPLKTLAENDELMAYKHNGFWKCMDTMKDKIELEDVYKYTKFKWKD